MGIKSAVCEYWASSPSCKLPSQVTALTSQAKMKFILFACLLAVAFAAPNQDAQTISDDRNIEADGTYSWAFQTDNGISRSEQGTPGVEGAINKSGEIRFTLDNGEEFVMTFIADELGFRPTSPFLPVAPVKK